MFGIRAPTVQSSEHQCCVFWPANACGVRMVKNIGKWWKSTFSIKHTRSHVRCTKKNKEKRLLVSDWEWLPKAGWHHFQMFFLSFPTVQMHVKACVRWSKYTTHQSGIQTIWMLDTKDYGIGYFWYLDPHCKQQFVIRLANFKLVKLPSLCSPSRVLNSFHC